MFPCSVWRVYQFILDVGMCLEYSSSRNVILMLGFINCISIVYD